MYSANTPVLKELVLLGGGHSHIAVLKRFGMNPIPGLRLTLITRDVQTPYSGMLPGFIAGHYRYDDSHIDLRRLVQFAGACLYHAEAEGLDLDNKQVMCRGRPPVRFDLLSIDIGSTPTPPVTVGTTESLLPVKPIDQFLSGWGKVVERCMNTRSHFRIAVVGGGAGGVELALCTQYRLQTLLNRKGYPADHIEFHLFTDTEEILPAHNALVRRKFRRILYNRGIQVHTHHQVIQVEVDRLHCENGESFPADAVLWVTHACAPTWLRESGLDTDSRGFVRVDDCLRSLSHPEVFAAGDIAAVVNHPRPKSGVFAVRQGPPLADNLRRAALGQRLKPFTPQRHFLSLISTGDKYAVASRSFWSLEGGWVWRVKDWIDQRFMRKYNELPEMKSKTPVSVNPALVGTAQLSEREASERHGWRRQGRMPSSTAQPSERHGWRRQGRMPSSEAALQELSALAMRCGGCGAKVGSTVLARVVSRLKPTVRGDVLVGLEAPDDAAVIAAPVDKVIVTTVDYFRAFIEDPYLFGKIAANHSLGDIYAMGAVPQSAMAIATIPYAAEPVVEEQLFQLMGGALEVLNQANAALVGGHSSEGAELSFGLAVTGLADPKCLLRKGGMKPGEALILTKPLGTGTLFAADMRGKAKGRWIDGAIESMLIANQAAAQCLLRHGASACTDITGFGLLGHVVEMVQASGVDLTLDLDALPILDGALETIALGIFSSLQPENLRLRRAIGNLAEAANHPNYPLLFDPQTAGGLLASVSGHQAQDCLQELRACGYGCAAIVGHVEPRGEALEPIRVKVTGLRN